MKKAAPAFPIRKTLILASSVSVMMVLWYITAVGWGWDSHRFINRSTVYHLPGQMDLFIQDSLFLAAHSVDADQRRVSGDTSFYAEAPRHYLDIDDYPNFVQLPRNLDSVIALYGWERVKQNGINPWATVWAMDSLVEQLARGDWAAAKLTASDVGHYVGDAHQPLHVTVNYNGQLSGNSGIHSRYETTMLSTTYYLSSLFITPDSVSYIDDQIEYIFDYLLHSNSLVDSVLIADNTAKVTSGWNGTGSAPASYYNSLWNTTRRFTLDQMQRATHAIGSLWYTAWVDAGLITPTGIQSRYPARGADFRLHQNYPNPFNASTNLSYQLAVGGTTRLQVFSVDGELITTLVDGNQSAGEYTVPFQHENLPSGVYLAQLQLGQFAQSIKLMLLR